MSRSPPTSPSQRSTAHSEVSATSGPGGGAYTGVGGGLYAGPGGGAHTGPGDPYMRNSPPIPVLITYMNSIGLAQLAVLFRQVHGHEFRRAPPLTSSPTAARLIPRDAGRHGPAGLLTCSAGQRQAEADVARGPVRMLGLAVTRARTA